MQTTHRMRAAQANGFSALDFSLTHDNSRTPGGAAKLRAHCAQIRFGAISFTSFARVLAAPSASRAGGSWL